jgi:hypothetical protein
VLVFVRFQLFRGVLVIVRPMIARVLMVMQVLIVSMFVLMLMSMPVDMAMHMSMRMGMCYAVTVRVLVSMGVRVFLFMAMLVLVFPFHIITSWAKMLVQPRIVHRGRTAVSVASMALLLCFLP